MCRQPPVFSTALDTQGNDKFPNSEGGKKLEFYSQPNVRAKLRCFTHEIRSHFQYQSTLYKYISQDVALAKLKVI